MQTLLIRGFVLSLALVGFTASTVASTPHLAKAGTSVSRATTTPPLCPPNDPDACGLD